MHETTIRKLSRALELITDYQKQKIDLRFLVNSLEGTILSLEEKLPEIFYKKWYEYWSELEIILALEQESVKRNKIDSELENLRTLLADIGETR